MTEKEIINKYLGVPYKHKGRSMSGVDCWGLAILVYHDLGLALWDIEEEYAEDWSRKGRDHFIENYYKEWLEVKEPHIFDGVLFKNNKGVANHGGLVLSQGRFMHCVKRHGVVISRLSDTTWKARIAGFYKSKVR